MTVMRPPTSRMSSSAALTAAPRAEPASLLSAKTSERPPTNSATAPFTLEKRTRSPSVDGRNISGRLGRD